MTASSPFLTQLPDLHYLWPEWEYYMVERLHWIIAIWRPLCWARSYGSDSRYTVFFFKEMARFDLETFLCWWHYRSQPHEELSFFEIHEFSAWLSMSGPAPTTSGSISRLWILTCSNYKCFDLCSVIYFSKCKPQGPHRGRGGAMFYFIIVMVLFLGLVIITLIMYCLIPIMS